MATKLKWPKGHKKMKLNEIFEVDGRFYAIVLPQTASERTMLAGGRNLIELEYLNIKI